MANSRWEFTSRTSRLGRLTSCLVMLLCLLALSGCLEEDEKKKDKEQSSATDKATEAESHETDERKKDILEESERQRADVLATAVIKGIEPASPEALAVDQSIVIVGSGFSSDTTVIWRDTAGQLFHRSHDHPKIRHVTPTRIEALVNFAQDAGEWSVQITNGDGTKSAWFPFAVSVPAQDVQQDNETSAGATHLTGEYYTTNKNPFYRDGYAPQWVYDRAGDNKITKLTTDPGIGPAVGNCTWYVYGRLREHYEASKEEMAWALGNASKWDEQATQANRTVVAAENASPEPGHIAQRNAPMHVAVVESVDGHQVTVSESLYVPDKVQDPSWRYRMHTYSKDEFDNYIDVFAAYDPLKAESSPDEQENSAAYQRRAPQGTGALYDKLHQTDKESE